MTTNLPVFARALTLLATIELAQRTGDWRVDGACDPDHSVDLLSRALDARDEAKVLHFTANLARDCVTAIERGDWTPQGGNIEYLESIAAPRQSYPSYLIMA